MSEPDVAQGKKLLSAVERILASNDTLKARVAEAKAKVKTTITKKDTLEDFAAKELIRIHGNKAAIAGAASGATGLIPGVGAVAGIAATLAGGLAELTYLLKTEVEMALCLQHLHGYDIDDPRERQLGFVLASVGTYDATGKNFFADIARVQGTAIFNYGPRRLGRIIVSALAAVAAMYLWKGLFKAIPFLGIAIGGGMNKVLTQRVGDRVSRDLRTRKQLLNEEPAAATASPASKKSKPKKPKAKKKKPSAAAVENASLN